MIARLLILVARGWQLGPSRILPPSCRYRPSCSAYAITALSRYGALRGSWLALRRVARAVSVGKSCVAKKPCAIISLFGRGGAVCRYERTT